MQARTYYLEGLNEIPVFLNFLLLFGAEIHEDLAFVELGQGGDQVVGLFQQDGALHLVEGGFLEVDAGRVPPALHLPQRLQQLLLQLLLVQITLRQAEDFLACRRRRELIGFIYIYS